MLNKLKRIVCLVLCLALLFEQATFAQVVGQLDLSAKLAGLGNALVQEKFRPLHLRYLAYDLEKNNFNLLIDRGNNKELSDLSLKNATKTLLNFFFIGLSLPDDSFWVNLRPDSPDNIIDVFLAKTDVGKILLEADVQLKKDTALATSPQTPEGKQYWDSLYKRAAELFGYDNITIPTLVRPWIVPGEVVVRQTQDNAYIYKATLKVMLEDDYLKGSIAYDFKDPRQKALNEYAGELMRQLIIPKLTREVNSARRYAPLRQVYYSLIFAQWFKAKYRGKNNLYAQRIDQRNLANLASSEPWSANDYFMQYRDSFKSGEYNLKETVSTPYGQSVRTYVSGGISLKDIRTQASSPLFIDAIRQLRPDKDLIEVSSDMAVKLPVIMGADGEKSVSSPVTEDSLSIVPESEEVFIEQPEDSSRRDFIRTLGLGVVGFALMGQELFANSIVIRGTSQKDLERFIAQMDPREKKIYELISKWTGGIPIEYLYALEWRESSGRDNANSGIARGPFQVTEANVAAINDFIDRIELAMRQKTFISEAEKLQYNLYTAIKEFTGPGRISYEKCIKDPIYNRAVGSMSLAENFYKLYQFKLIRKGREWVMVERKKGEAPGYPVKRVTFAIYNWGRVGQLIGNSRQKGLLEKYGPERWIDHIPLVTRQYVTDIDKIASAISKAGKPAAPVQVASARASKTASSPITGTFIVAGERARLEVVERQEQAAALDAWFNVQQSRYFGPFDWAHAMRTHPEGFMVRLVSENGDTLGLGYFHKGVFLFSEERPRTVYVGDYLEAAQTYRGQGIGKIILAQAIQASLADTSLDSDMKGVIVVHPALDKEYAPPGKRAQEFFFKAGFQAAPYSQRDIFEEEEDYDRNLFLFSSSANSKKLLAEVRSAQELQEDPAKQSELAAAAKTMPLFEQLPLPFEENPQQAVAKIKDKSRRRLSSSSPVASAENPFSSIPFALPAVGEKIDKGTGNNSAGVWYTQGPSAEFPYGLATKYFSSPEAARKEFINLLALSLSDSVVRPVSLQGASYTMGYAPGPSLQDVVDGKAQVPAGVDLRKEFSSFGKIFAKQSQERIIEISQDGITRRFTIQQAAEAAVQESGGSLSAENVKQLRQQFLAMSQPTGRTIYPQDIEPKNTIITPDGIVIIDAGQMGLLTAMPLEFLIDSWTNRIMRDVPGNIDNARLLSSSPVGNSKNTEIRLPLPNITPAGSGEIVITASPPITDTGIRTTKKEKPIQEQEALVQKAESVLAHIVSQRPLLIAQLIKKLGFDREARDYRAEISYYNYGVYKNVFRLKIENNNEVKTVLLALKLPAQDGVSQEQAGSLYQEGELDMHLELGTTDLASEIISVIYVEKADAGLGAVSTERPSREAEKNFAIIVIEEFIEGLTIAEHIYTNNNGVMTPEIAKQCIAVLARGFMRLNEENLKNGRPLTGPSDFHLNNIIIEKGTGKFVPVDLGKRVEYGDFSAFVAALVYYYGGKENKGNVLDVLYEQWPQFNWDQIISKARADIIRFKLTSFPDKLDDAALNFEYKGMYLTRANCNRISRVMTSFLNRSRGFSFENGRLVLPAGTAKEQMSVDQAADSASSPIADTVRQQIKNAAGRITFADFMRTALYDPVHGYYTRHVQIGHGAHWDTWAQDPRFAVKVAAQLLQMWELMGRPSEFSVVEMGAGNGVLARNVLRHLLNQQKKDSSKGLYDALTYTIVDVSPALIAKQQETLANFSQRQNKVQWKTLAELSSIRGVFLSNELVDAFSVHRVRKTVDGSFQEAYVVESEEGFADTWERLSPDTRRFIDALAAAEKDAWPADKELALNLEVGPWQREINRILDRGFVLTVDYGARRNEMFTSNARSVWSGARENIPIEDIYSSISEGVPLDITAHAPFQDIMEAGGDLGLKTILYKPLRDSGLYFKSDDVAQYLSISKDFQVLIQSKAVEVPAGVKLFAQSSSPIQTDTESRDASAVEYLSRDPRAWVVFSDMLKLSLRNDYYGRKAADVFIQDVISIAQSVAEENGGIAYRMGDRADEIGIILPSTLLQAEVEQILIKLQKRIEAEYQSIGFAVVPTRLVHGALFALGQSSNVLSIEDLPRLLLDGQTPVRMAAILFRKEKGLDARQTLDKVLGSFGIINGLGTVEDLKPPYLPVGAVSADRSLADSQDRLVDGLHRAEQAQRQAKIDGTPVGFTTPRRRERINPVFKSAQEEAQINALLEVQRGKLVDESTALKASLNAQGRTEEAQTLSIDDGYAAFVRRGLATLFKHILTNGENRDVVLPVLEHPDTFYFAIHAFGKWQLVMIRNAITTNDDSLTEEFMSIMQASGRTSLRQKGQFPFKVINDYEGFGHHFGNQLIKLLSAYLYKRIQEAVVTTEGALTSVELADVLQKATFDINTFVNRHHISVNLEAISIDINDIPEKTRGDANKIVKKALNVLDVLANSRRDLLPPGPAHTLRDSQPNFRPIVDNNILVRGIRAQRGKEELAIVTDRYAKIFQASSPIAPLVVELNELRLKGDLETEFAPIFISQILAEALELDDQKEVAGKTEAGLFREILQDVSEQSMRSHISQYWILFEGSIGRIKALAEARQEVLDGIQINTLRPIGQAVIKEAFNRVLQLAGQQIVPVTEIAFDAADRQELSGFRDRLLNTRAALESAKTDYRNTSLAATAAAETLAFLRSKTDVVSKLQPVYLTFSQIDFDLTQETDIPNALGMFMVWADHMISAGFPADTAEKFNNSIARSLKMLNDSIEALERMLAFNGGVLATKQIEAMRGATVIIDMKKVGPAASSPIADKKDEKGGIDFRSMPITVEPALSGRSMTEPLSSRSKTSISDPELREIENMINAGIIPSAERLREYAQAHLKAVDAQEQLEKILFCIADILKLQEENCQETDSGFKELLLVIETKPLNEMFVSLGAISAIASKAPRSSR